jgi:nucleotide-binding universal stress UspA family protein
VSQIKTIIAGLALDGGDDPVLARAVSLAGQHGARLLLVHVIENMASVDAEVLALSSDALQAMLEKEAGDRLEQIAGTAALAGRSRNIVTAGKPFDVITGLMLRENADIVVIGPGKPRNLREKVFGSTADRVVRSAPAPVLIVRSEQAQSYRRVVVAADLSPQSLSASRAARTLAPEAAIEHLHIVEMPLSFEETLLRAGTPMTEIDRYRRSRLIAARERIKTAFAAAGEEAPLKLRVVEGDAREVMVRQARNRRTDLVALGTHGRDTASQMLLGSVARNVLQAASCDVLVTSR